MQNRIIREADPKDSLEIAKVHVKAWQCAYRGQIPDDYLDKLSVSKRQSMWEGLIKNPYPRSKTLVGQLNNQIVGFCSYGPSRDKDSSEDIGKVFSIYIDPDNTGKGVGTGLIKKAVNDLKGLGFKKVTLWVFDSNEKAKEFYKKRGWEFDGKTKIEKRDNFELKEVRYYLDLDKNIA